MSERILVLGAGGFIGRHLVRRLASMGQDVLAVSRRPWPDIPASVEMRLAEPRSPLDFAPLLNGVGTVFHLASSSTPGSTAGHPLDELEANLRPTLALLESLQERPLISLVYVSSAGTLYQPAPDTPSREDSPLLPRSYHGAGKAAAEAFIHAWASQYDGRTTILRPSNVYGPGQLEKGSFGIVPTALGKLRRGEELTVWGDGNIVRDFLYVDDFVALCERVLVTPKARGSRIVNVACGKGTRINDLFGVMELVTGRPLLRRYVAGRGVDAPRADIDPSLARQLFDWTARVDLEQGLQETWRWLNRQTP